MAFSSCLMGRNTTLRIRKILVALDHSELSKKVLGVAIDLATFFNAELCMLHVVVKNLQPEYENVARIESDKSFSDYVEMVREQFFDQGMRAARGAGLEKTRLKLVKGDVVDKIIETARTEETDMIILGTHSRSGLSRIISGSASTRVCTRAKCTCVIVR